MTRRMSPVATNKQTATSQCASTIGKPAAMLEHRSRLRTEIPAARVWDQCGHVSDWGFAAMLLLLAESVKSVMSMWRTVELCDSDNTLFISRSVVVRRSTGFDNPRASAAPQPGSRITLATSCLPPTRYREIEKQRESVCVCKP